MIACSQLDWNKKLCGTLSISRYQHLVDESTVNQTLNKIWLKRIETDYDKIMSEIPSRVFNFI